MGAKGVTRGCKGAGIQAGQLFFLAGATFFSRAKFLARRARNLAGPRKKKLLGIPAAGPASTQPGQDIFFADREKNILLGPPLAGRRPVGLSL